MNRIKILIVTVKSWNIKNAYRFKQKHIKTLDTEIISDKDDFYLSVINKINPRYIFFPHWSWIIPENIFNKYECVVFHMTDLPYGRGGTPLQNLISNKIYNTKISAIRVEKGIDSGPVYIKRSINIESGSADNIYRKISKIIFFKMIPNILKYEPIPTSQKGKIVSFKRRIPEESNIIQTKISNLSDMYDFIRMLDVEGYPKAFIKKDNIKILFSDVHKIKNKLIGKYEITYEN